MNSIETNNLIFQDYTNIPYLEDIVFYVDEHEEEILDFFKMRELTSKWKVKIISFDEFKEYMIKNYGKYEDYMAGQTSYRERTVYSLNIEDQVNYTKHKQADITKINKMLIHEFVHVCYQEVLPNPVRWFNEGLATYLSHQDRELKDISEVDLTILKNNFNDIASSGGYTYSYFVVRYLFENYPKEEIYKFVFDREYLIDNTNRIFDETKKWVKEQLNTREKNKPIA